VNHRGREAAACSGQTPVWQGGVLICRVLDTGRHLVLALLVGVMAGCAGSGPVPSSWVEPPPVSPSPGTATSGPVPRARVGTPAKSTRVRFVPERLTLQAGASAAVKRAVTVDGELHVPTNVNHVGWWDGSASAGDPFGSTLIAGHVDSATGAVGFFAKLLHINVGSKVTLQGSGHRLSYRVTEIHTVAQEALASHSRAFDQTGDHRLVLITCTGVYRPGRGGYDRNLVVIARPLGLAS
jgi:LPXTG-site transpeptidase (sortase) family protein